MAALLILLGLSCVFADTAVYSSVSYSGCYTDDKYGRTPNMLCNHGDKITFSRDVAEYGKYELDKTVVKFYPVQQTYGSASGVPTCSQYTYSIPEENTGTTSVTCTLNIPTTTPQLAPFVGCLGTGNSVDRCVAPASMGFSAINPDVEEDHDSLLGDNKRHDVKGAVAGIVVGCIIGVFALAFVFKMIFAPNQKQEDVHLAEPQYVAQPQYVAAAPAL
eukprot:NODE_3791_length_851_cov_365.060773_g3768_i0.p1 GENE.NODE_3791_length_851_cov_365.060773_g3768_i0~~NODE_3791_length_851_cov_365.060773_g3768_i0.p1  ORF type:complete len:238 (+),score=62.35 NODE_3791_length_851_cov_365.060773_g3768_i0:62-715(+)